MLAEFKDFLKTLNLAPDYDANSTYNVGDYCVHSGGLYRCKTAITSAEAWTSTKWTSVSVSYYIGKIENVKENVLGVYSVGNYNRVEAIGRDSSYDIAELQILVHWNRNAKETERIARNLYNSLRYINSATMGGIYVEFLDLEYGEPVFLGTDENNVYEYHILLRVYYRR